MAGMAGFEPTNARVKVWCLTAWRHPNAFEMRPGIGHTAYYSIAFWFLQLLFFRNNSTFLYRKTDEGTGYCFFANKMQKSGYFNGKGLFFAATEIGVDKCCAEWYYIQALESAP